MQTTDESFYGYFQHLAGPLDFIIPQYHMTYVSVKPEAKQMTPSHEAVIRPCVGRKKRWSEDMQARFKAGTFARMKAVLKDEEDRTDLVRIAVERELTRREKAATVKKARF
jgi:hypothetical protein